MNTILKNLSASNTHTNLTGTNILFTSAVFFGYSGFSAQGLPLNNTSNIYLGIESGRACVTLTSGASFNWTLQGKISRESLSNFWINGTQNDGVYVVYYP
jgi:hypothetical protein